jgi:N-acetylglucosamine-6-sulfatase
LSQKLPIRALIALLLVISLSSSVATASKPNATRPPNILFILTDDQEVDTLKYMPNVITLIQDQGVTFSNFLVNVSLCCPSRATILRGQYAHNTHVLTNSGTNGGADVFFNEGKDQSTIATWLQANGYETGLFGKYLNGFPGVAGQAYIPPGWSNWGVASRGAAFTEFHYGLNHNGEVVQYGGTPEDYGTDVYTRLTIDFIKQAVKDEKPFFAYLAPYAPHAPYTPAPRHALLFPGILVPHPPNFNEEDISDKPAYIRRLLPFSPEHVQRIDLIYRMRLQSLQAIDEGVSLLVNTLEEIGQLDNTYIVFASDNGYHLGLHRMIAGKATPYEEDILIPMVVRGPGIPVGKTIDHLAGNVDIAPTFAEWAGAEIPDFVDGRSLVPLMGNLEPPHQFWRQAFLLERWALSYEENPGDMDLLEPDDPDGTNVLIGTPVPASAPTLNPTQEFLTKLDAGIPAFVGLRTYEYTYVEYSTGEKEFYDLKNDPYQLNNMINSANPQLVSTLSDIIREMKQCAAKSCQDAELRPLTP